jgi:hypothetical protein
MIMHMIRGINTIVDFFHIFNISSSWICANHGIISNNHGDRNHPRGEISPFKCIRLHRAQGDLWCQQDCNFLTSLCVGKPSWCLTIADISFDISHAPFFFNVQLSHKRSHAPLQLCHPKIRAAMFQLIAVVSLSLALQIEFHKATAIEADIEVIIQMCLLDSVW